MSSQNTSKKRDYIDLTASTSDNEEFRSWKTARFRHGRDHEVTQWEAGQVKPKGELIDLTKSDPDDSITPKAEQHLANRGYRPFGERYGTLSTTIENVATYSGEAGCREQVSLVRESDNKDDSNAIRVDDARGRRIGWVHRQIAAKLAEYLDFKLLVARAVVSGARRNFDIPITLSLFGTSESVARKRLKEKMEKDGLPVEAVSQEDTRKDKRPKPERGLEEEDFLIESGDAPISRAESFCHNNPEWLDNTDPVHEDMNQDLAAADNEIDDFEVEDMVKSNQEYLKHLPRAGRPARIRTPNMHSYQLQGLAWLLKKENPLLPPPGSTETVQLWQRLKGAKQGFRNVATKTIEVEDPKLASGGILADDMGLGKTLEIISLIVADKELFNLASGRDEGATLIVAPKGVMSNWTNQIVEHVDSARPLKFLLYHGSKKPKIDLKYLKRNNIDVVITSYDTVALEYMPGSNDGTIPGPIPRAKGLFSLKWRRVVLDEAHEIRNPKTKKANAATSLISRSRWAMTGTPIVNDLINLYSLLRFIGITGGLEKLDIFNINLRPKKKSDAAAIELLHNIMDSLCLRRTKEMPFINIRLPKLKENLHQIQFTKSEKDRYCALEEEAQGLLKEYKMQQPKSQEKKVVYYHLLEVLLRLRQVCNHWRLCTVRMAPLVLGMELERAAQRSPEERERSLQSMLQLILQTCTSCPICHKNLAGHTPVITPCGHVFGKRCISHLVRTQHRCDECHMSIEDESQLVEQNHELDEENAEDCFKDIDINTSSSSKIEAVLSILKKVHQEPNPKVVIFSQWTSFLSLLQSHLIQAGYTCTRLDGKLNVPQRDEVIEIFSSDRETSIMLASLKASAVGINLAVANTAILCDSWWAPAIEDQAVDRLHRLGQKREVTVWRLVIKESIEYKVLEIQKDKRELMQTALKEKDKRQKQDLGTIEMIDRLLA